MKLTLTGAFFVLLQALSYIGTLKSRGEIPFYFSSLYDVFVMIGFNLCLIIGLTLITLGLIKLHKENKNNENENEFNEEQTK